MEALSSVSKHGIDATDERNNEYLTIDRGLRNCVRESEGPDYGSVRDENDSLPTNDEDYRVRIEAVPETVKAEDIERSIQKYGASQKLASYLVLFFVGSVFITMWPHPRLKPTEHKSFVVGRDACIKSFNTCTTDGTISNRTCTEKLVTCESRLTNPSDRCVANYVNCTSWAHSLEGEHQKEGLERCENNFKLCQEYHKRQSNWKGVAFATMILTVLAVLSQLPPVIFVCILLEIAIGVYSDSFRGYALGNFAAGLVLPCLVGPLSQRQAQARQQARTAQQVEDILERYRSYQREAESYEQP